MAFRIHDSVAGGEIDNRQKGIVRGKIWLEGRGEPVTLELKGNAWPDLAGCLLTFTNPQKRIPHPDLDALHPLQHGSIGDLTASRKVRVFDVPLIFGTPGQSGDNDLGQFIFEFQTTGVKLAGALNSIARGEGFPDAAFTVAYLKRALDHLHKSQAGLEAIAARNMLPATMVAQARKELFEIRESIIRLMDEFRGRA